MKKLQKYFEMKKLIFILSIILIISIGYIIRLYPFLEFSPIRGTFNPGVHYSTYFVIQNGYMHSSIPSFSYTSDIVNGGLELGEYARFLLNSPLLIITGQTSLLDIELFYQYFLWQGVILIPLLSMLIYYQMTKIKQIQPLYFSYLLIFIFSIIGISPFLAITADGGIMDYYGWAIILILFYLTLKNYEKSDVRFTALSVLFLFLLQLYHHTSALLYFFIISSILINQIISKKKYITLNHYLLYSVSFVIYISYLTIAFRQYFKSLFNAISFVLNPYESTTQQSWIIMSDVIIITGASTIRIIVRGLDLILFSLPIFIFIYLKLRNKLMDQISDLIFYVVISIVPVSILLFSWGGFGGLFYRITYFISLISIITTGYLLTLKNTSFEKKRANTKKITNLKIQYNMTKIITIIVLLSVTTSTYLYISSNIGGANSLTWQEYNSEEWSNTFITKNSVIFSDSRLASPLLYYDFRKSIALEDEGKDTEGLNIIKNQYNVIYQNETPDKLRDILLDVTVGVDKIDFLILSSEFTQYPPGVKSYFNVFKPAAKDYMIKFDNSRNFNLIFHIGETRIYAFNK